MITADDFPNLATPVWDRIRIPPRRGADEIGIEMCREAGLDISEIRKRPGSHAPHELMRLRHRIAWAMARAKVPNHEICAWLGGINASTLGDYLREAARAEDFADD